MSAEKIHWEGKQWKVTDRGLETIDENLSFIPAEELGKINKHHDNEMSDWPFHISHKTWVDYSEFVKAFFIALDVHKGKYTPLSNAVIGEGLYEGLKVQNEMVPIANKNVA